MKQSLLLYSLVMILSGCSSPPPDAYSWKTAHEYFECSEQDYINVMEDENVKKSVGKNSYSYWLGRAIMKYCSPIVNIKE